MREILFRGKRTDNGEWVQGYYAKAKDYMSEKEIHVIFPLDLELFPHSEFSSYEEVDPETVGQYTGWEDMSGKKIFEGDICRFKEWWRGKPCWIGHVLFEQGIYIIAGGPNEECDTPFYIQMSRLDIDEIEVIGNMRDNPELIGGTE